MNREDLTKNAFMMISNLKEHFGLHGLHKSTLAF